MRIYFRCRRCRRALSDLATQAGKPVVCPGCKAEIIVPSGSEMALPALEQSSPAPVRVAAVIAELPFIPQAPTAKTNPATAQPVSRPSAASWAQDKTWLYRIAAVAGVLLLLGTAGAVTSQVWLRQKDAQFAVPPAEDQGDQIAELNEGLAPSAAECCKGCESAVEEHSSTDQAERAVVANLNVEKKGQDLVNDSAKAPKHEGKPEVTEKPKTEPEAQIVVKRRQKKSEEELRKELAWAPEIGLGATASGVLHNWTVHIKGSLNAVSPQEVHLVDLATASPIVTNRPDLGGLPFRQGKSSQIRPKEARVLADLAPKLRLYLFAAAPMDEEGHRPKDPVLLREVLRNEMRGQRPEWLRYEAIPSMMQLMMPEDTPIRMLLVEMLAQIPEKQATVALAQRAIFDLSPEVRDAALAALKMRKADDYRPILLNGLRYLWSPVADQAAEALIALNVRDEQSIGRLIIQLNEPDLSNVQVIRNRGGFQREVVRAAHLTNCLLCHPPSVTGTEGVLAQDPIVTLPGSNLVNISSAHVNPYPYEGSRVSLTTSAVPIGSEKQLLVRADITFIRQDFSAIQPVLQAGTTLPTHMRFDYFVRTKWIPEKKARELKTDLAQLDTYPQRESVLFALRELTGRDAGSTTEAWLKLFPRAELDAEAAKYRDQLISASAKKRDEVLSTLKDGEGVVYSVALADAIPKLAKDFRDKARQALSERLSRMTPETLRDKFADDDVEIRKAAIQACVIKGEASLVSDLSELLEDPSPAVAGLAGDAIKVLNKSKTKQKNAQTTEVSAAKN